MRWIGNLLILAKMGKKQKKKYKTLYQDKDVLIKENGIEIKCYYFPIATSKFIPFSKIKQIEYGGLQVLGGQGRLWGMSIGKMGYWFAGDLDRFSRDRYIAVHTDSKIKPTFTTANDKEVYEMLFKLWKQGGKEKQQKSQMMDEEDSRANIGTKNQDKDE